MASGTKTFSGRADAEKLEYADRLARISYGMSFGQYCSSLILEATWANAKLPSIEYEKKDTRKLASVNKLKKLSERFDNPKMATLSDDDLRAMIGERYAS